MNLRHKAFRAIKIAFCILFPVVAAQAQTGSDSALIAAIRMEAFSHSALPQLAYQLTDVCGPRLTNSPGYRKAVSWAVQQFAGWGVKAAPEAWGEYGKSWSNKTTVVSLQTPYYTPLIAYAVPWTRSTTGTLTAPVAMLDNFDSASIDKWGDSLQGKIVMVRKKDTLLPPLFESDAWRYADSDLATLKDHSHLSADMIAAYKVRLKSQYDTRLYLQQKGALALLNGKGRDGTVFVAAFTGYAKQYQPTLPELILTSEGYLQLQRFAEHRQPVRLQVNVQNTFYNDDLTGYNVVGEIPGTDPVLKKEVVMLGAHLDSWTSATGATDNGAGCIVIMEVARILKALNLQPKRTIRIVLWGGEEEVIRGSVGYVKKHFISFADMKKKPDWETVSAYYNLDNGTGKIRGIYTMGNDSIKGLFQNWLQPFTKDGASTVSSRYSGGSDQEAFYAAGIPAFAFIQDPLDYDTRTHHSNMDVYERLSFDDLKQCAAVITSFVYHTAGLPAKLPHLPMPEKGSFVLENGLLP